MSESMGLGVLLLNSERFHWIGRATHPASREGSGRNTTLETGRPQDPGTEGITGLGWDPLQPGQSPDALSPVDVGPSLGLKSTPQARPVGYAR